VERKNKKIVYILFSISIVLIIQGVFLVINSDDKLLQTNEYIVQYEVVEGRRLGLDVNNTALSFGKTSPGGSNIIRYINITNSYEFPIEVKILFSKNVANVIISNDSFILLEDEVINIPFKLTIPKAYPFGKYKGKVKFDFYKFDV